MKPLDILKALTPDARAALKQSGVSRRSFLKRSGVLVVGFSTGLLTSRLGAPGSAAAQRLDGAGSNQLDAWIAIGADGKVTTATIAGSQLQDLNNATIAAVKKWVFKPGNRSIRLIVKFALP